MSTFSLDHGIAAAAAGARLEQLRKALGIAPNPLAESAARQGWMPAWLQAGVMRAVRLHAATADDVLTPEIVTRQRSHGATVPARRTGLNGREHALAGHRLLGHAMEASRDGSLYDAYAQWVGDAMKARGAKGQHLTERFQAAMANPATSALFGVALADQAMGLTEEISRIAPGFRFVYDRKDSALPPASSSMLKELGAVSGWEPGFSDELSLALGMTTLGRVEYRVEGQMGLAQPKDEAQRQRQAADFARVAMEIAERLVYNQEAVPAGMTTPGQEATPALFRH